MELGVIRDSWVLESSDDPFACLFSRNVELFIPPLRIFNEIFLYWIN
jgi:hypothetical protein